MEGSERQTPSKSQPKRKPDAATIAPAAEGARSLDFVSYNYCMQCAIGFHDDASHTAHSRSDEHAIMDLATSDAYFERETAHTGFPPLYYCILCNVFSLEYNDHEKHLFSDVHRDVAHFLRIISCWKEKILVGSQCKSKEPCTVQDFESLKNPPPNYCQLCDKQCNSIKTLENHIKAQTHRKYDQMVRKCYFCNLSFVNFSFYERHFTTDLHIKMRDFMSKMLIPESEITAKTPEKKCYASQGAEASARPMLYFCKLCSIEFNDAKSFRSHRKLPIHVRVHKLINKISLKREDAAKMIEAATKETVPRVHYCELCKVWCLSPAQTYEEHVRSTEHLFSRSTEVVHNWECSPKNPPSGHKPWG